LTYLEIHDDKLDIFIKQQNRVKLRFLALSLH